MRSWYLQVLISTKRPLLHEFNDADWKAVLQYQADPAFLRCYPWLHRSPGDLREFVCRFIEWSQERPRTKFQLAMILQSEKQLIGNCGLRMPSSDSKDGEFGCELNPRYWRHAFGMEAARAMLQFGFGKLQLHRIWAECAAENVAASRLAEKIGMQKERNLREHKWTMGRWWDTLIYAILDHEWKANTS
ncbi:MAG: GNAT family N-acetyltransferase [Bacteroidota bacterium]